MRKLILDLLDLTRIESGSKSRHLEDFNLCEAVTLAVEAGALEARARKVTIRAEMPDSLVMTADRDELLMILNNLVSNAVKYNRDGGAVTIHVADLGDRAEVSVTDTGIGMSSGEVSRLFGEFVRIKNEKTASILGSGLGLSIVKKLVSLYEGEIRVESKPDAGSTFTIRLDKHCVLPEVANLTPDRPPVATGG
jgi:signal transduction histidine kinase